MLETTFVLTEEHIKLLRASHVDTSTSETCYGAAQIDPKRPYGSKDAEVGMARILGVEVIDDDGDEHLRTADRQRLRELHEQTPTALQIVLDVGAFAPGVYERENPYSGRWVYARGE